MPEERNDCKKNVIDNYIGLNDFVVHFTEEVETYFKEKIGEEEFLNICKLSCQAPSSAHEARF